MCITTERNHAWWKTLSEGTFIRILRHLYIHQFFNPLGSLPIQPIYLKTEPKWPNRQCCLADSSKTTRRIFIFSIVLQGTEYLSYVKYINTFALTLFEYIISVLASMNNSFRFVISSETISYYCVMYWMLSYACWWSSSQILSTKYVLPVFDS